LAVKDDFGRGASGRLEFRGGLLVGFGVVLNQEEDDVGGPRYGGEHRQRGERPAERPVDPTGVEEAEDDGRQPDDDERVDEVFGPAPYDWEISE
jgi:hypothetical protein